MIHTTRFAAKTDQGLVRNHNEDCYALLPERGLVVVADGMGGYNAGEIASQLAVELVVEQLRDAGADGSPRGLAEAILHANQAIWEAAGSVPELERMGTTIVLGRVQEQSLVYAWVGDSRLYRLRDGELTKLTVDHTLVQELVDKGVFESVEDAMAAGVRDNVLTRALGSESWVAASSGSSELRPGDLYLYCTDGLSHMVADTDLAQTLGEAAEDLEATASRLVELAYGAGAMDNITVVLMRVLAGAVAGH